MSYDPVTALLDVGGKIIDKIFPDPEQRDAAKLALIKEEREGRLEEVKTSMSVMLAEAQSNDPYTSRARPSFLYVVYILMLFSIPMGILHAVSPETAANVSTGATAWFSAIPESIIDMFTIVMMGYIGGRSFEKVKGKTK